MPDAASPGETIIPDNPLSSAVLRYSMRTTATAAGPGPHETRPFGLRFAQTLPLPPPRPVVRYCHFLQVAVDEDGRPMIERMGWEEDQKSNGLPRPRATATKVRRRTPGPGRRRRDDCPHPRPVR